MYDIYNPDEFEYCYPSRFIKIYNQEENSPTYTWNFGDAVRIPFLIQCPYNKEIYSYKITVYNFRYEALFQSSVSRDEHDKIYFILTSEESEKYFPCGVYFCEIKALSYPNEESELPEVVTILPPEVCSFYVR